MKVDICKGGLIIEPETDFEDSYIRNAFRSQTEGPSPDWFSSGKCFVKCGLTPAELIGIKICFPQEQSEAEEKTEKIDFEPQPKE
jgi:hypothetical protein